MTPPRILVKIAAYRDPELPLTIRSALTQADHPARLRFAIVNQHDTAVDEISLAEWDGDPRFRVMNVLHTQTLGLGWARYVCDTMWRQEELTLQIDSHMRFDAGWDSVLVADWLSRDDPRAVLTGYPRGYEYDDDGAEVVEQVGGPVALRVSRVNAQGESALEGLPIEDAERALLLVAGGFQLAPGHASREVPNDRRVQTGDELVQSLRLFTFGYSVYSPRVLPLAHLYLRAEKTRVRLPSHDQADPTLARIAATVRAESVRASLDLLFGSGRGLGPVRSRALFLHNLRGYMGVSWPQVWSEAAGDTDDTTSHPLVTTQQENR